MDSKNALEQKLVDAATLNLLAWIAKLVTLPTLAFLGLWLWTQVNQQDDDIAELKRSDAVQNVVIEHYIRQRYPEFTFPETR